MVSWQCNDGIKSVVMGLLFSGVSGYVFNYSDIGGYCMVDFFFIWYWCIEEFLLWWMEFNVFFVVFCFYEVRVLCNYYF